MPIVSSHCVQHDYEVYHWHYTEVHPYTNSNAISDCDWPAKSVDYQAFYCIDQPAKRLQTIQQGPWPTSLKSVKGLGLHLNQPEACKGALDDIDQPAKNMVYQGLWIARPPCQKHDLSWTLDYTDLLLKARSIMGLGLHRPPVKSKVYH